MAKLFLAFAVGVFLTTLAVVYIVPAPPCPALDFGVPTPFSWPYGDRVGPKGGKAMSDHPKTSPAPERPSMPLRKPKTIVVPLGPSELA